MLLLLVVLSLQVILVNAAVGCLTNGIKPLFATRQFHLWHVAVPKGQHLEGEGAGMWATLHVSRIRAALVAQCYLLRCTCACC
jgi:hypothetical protein